MSEAQRQVPMPEIVNWAERRWFKDILEARDSPNLATYAYIVNLNGDLIYLGRCVGYGLPYSVQYTNPMRPSAEVLVADNHRAGNGRTTVSGMLPQPDPNGLFMPEGLAATWLMMLGPDGEVRPVYVEPEIIVSPFPLHDNS